MKAMLRLKFGLFLTADMLRLYQRNQTVNVVSLQGEKICVYFHNYTKHILIRNVVNQLRILQGVKNSENYNVNLSICVCTQLLSARRLITATLCV